MPGQMMTRASQIQKAIKLLAPSPDRRDECLRDIGHALGRVEAAASFKIMTSKSSKAGLRAYANALRKLRAAYPKLGPYRPWFSLSEIAGIAGAPNHIDRQIELAEAFLRKPTTSSRASQHKAAVRAANDLLRMWGHETTATRNGRWAKLSGILAGNESVDLFDLMRSHKREPPTAVEKLRGEHSVLYRLRR
jgi:hypothetical protein